MSGLWNLIWWGGNPDAEDPESGLTKKEISLVQKSWAPLTANSMASGTRVFVRLFNDHPEAKQLFKYIRNVSGPEYTLTPQFKAHVCNFMSSLTTAVEHLNEAEVVAALMHKLGEDHAKIGIQEAHFAILKEVLVKFFVEVLKMDSATLAAWSKTVDFWNRNIFEGLSGA